MAVGRVTVRTHPPCAWHGRCSACAAWQESRHPTSTSGAQPRQPPWHLASRKAAARSEGRRQAVGACPSGCPWHTMSWDGSTCGRVAKMKQQSGIFVSFLGVKGGDMQQTIPIMISPIGGWLRAMLPPDFRQAGVYSGEDPKAELVLTF